MLKRHRFLLFAVVAIVTLAIGISAIWACHYRFEKLGYGPSVVYVKEYNTWELQIIVSGPGLSDLVITDVIPAELEVHEYAADIGSVSFKENPKAATHITWSIPGPLPDTGYFMLRLCVVTRLSPSGKFYRFTSPGCYYLNEGAHLEGTRDGMSWSDDTNGIKVTVLP